MAVGKLGFVVAERPPDGLSAKRQAMVAALWAFLPERPTDEVTQSREDGQVPLYMDTHRNVSDLSTEAVAGAHMADLATQEKYGVSYKQYWYNEAEGVIHCLVDAPDAEAANTVHREAHGMVADQIIEVQEGH